MELDFSKLDKLGFLDMLEVEEDGEAPQKPQKEPTAEHGDSVSFSSLDRAIEAPEGQELAYTKLTREKEDWAKVKEAYKEYQDNIRKAGELRSQILYGARAGEAPVALLLKACQCISSMTGDSVFTEQVEADLKAIYGEGLLEPAPIEWELDAVRDRLEKLQKALNKPQTREDRERIERAVEAHRKRAGELTGLFRQAEENREAV